MILHLQTIATSVRNGQKKFSALYSHSFHFWVSFIKLWTKNAAVNTLEFFSILPRDHNATIKT